MNVHSTNDGKWLIFTLQYNMGIQQCYSCSEQNTDQLCHQLIDYAFMMPIQSQEKAQTDQLPRLSGPVLPSLVHQFVPLILRSSEEAARLSTPLILSSPPQPSVPPLSSPSLRLLSLSQHSLLQFLSLISL